jgi:ABC-type dipeptide/oligopeptide/nickel transport system ATPase component
MNPLLAVQDLRVTFPGSGNEIAPVDGVTFSIDPGETLALVGESGSGKTLTSLALVRLVPPPGRIAAGSIRFGGTDLLALAPASLRQVRGRRIGMVFQDPMTSLNPVLSVGDQISETIRAHFPASRAEARRRSEALLLEVGLGDSAGTYKSYPHQLSGGMRQRAMLAIALAGEPELLVADEPTSALDVSVQARVLDLFQELQQEHGFGCLFISHDLAVVEMLASRIAVMHYGRLVEVGPREQIVFDPQDPYTQRLVAAVPVPDPEEQRARRVQRDEILAREGVS